MSKYKSLGSSPIGIHSNESNLNFIPDLGVSQEHKTDAGHSSHLKSVNRESEVFIEEEDKETAAKKVVSYYLEEDLISELKTAADERDVYYSTLVSWAVREWLDENTGSTSEELHFFPKGNNF